MRTIALIWALAAVHAAPKAATIPTPAPAKSAAPAPARLVIAPGVITLTHLRDARRVIVTAHSTDGATNDVTLRANLALANTKLAALDRDATLKPLSDGETILTATLDGKSATIPVRVTGAKREVAWDFATQVAPLFTRYGCNAANCHGSPVGKPSTENNFKLSLFGDDPAFDFEHLNKDFKDPKKARERINAQSPDDSLLLKKPLGALPHGGGPRFAKDSSAARLLRDWIAAGAPKGAVYAPELSFLGSTVSDLEVYPKERVFSKKGDTQRLIVIARFENGQTEDVTLRTRFSAADDEIARVAEDGEVRANKDGETVIVARYLNFVKAPRIMVVTRVQSAAFAFPPNNYLDRIVAAKWRKIRVVPSDLSADEEFLRRAFLDLIGQLPTVDETLAFIADRDPDKRKRVIDSLLDRTEYIDFWTVRWADLLRNDRRYLTVKGMWTFHRWIRESVEANKPWDQFVREIITASGSTYRNGPANFYRVLRPIEERTSGISQAFLGTRIECARCHNHPFDKWTNDDYHGMAAFFARVAIKNGDLIDNTGTLQEEIVVVNRNGDHTRDVPNRPKQPMNPKLLGGQPLPREGEADRRLLFADWLTAKDNRQFARALVNRLWGHLLGRGIVDPVDDFRVSNPPINDELLEALARDFIDHNFDVKHMLRTIANSRVYQLTWKPNATNANENRNFSRHYVQRMSAEQLLDALNAVTGETDKFGELPRGTKAIQLPDTSSMGTFLDIFGKPKRASVCECERNTFSNMSQALHLINSPAIQQKIQSQNGRIATLLKQNKTDVEIVANIYLAALQRAPRNKELAEALATIDQAATRAEGCEDVLWAVLNSREFMFNH